MPLTIELNQNSHATIATLKGVLTGNTTLPLENALVPQLSSRSRLLLDLREVSHISSAGIRKLRLLHRQAQNEGSRLVLVGLSPRMSDIFEITGFLDVFEQSPDLPSAFATPGNGHV
jgi:anti-anti-sigma factor